MSTLFCCDSLRRSAVEHSSAWNGIDFLQVLDDPAGPLAERQTTLLVHFIRDIAPLSLGIANVRIEGGERLRHIQLVSVEQAPLLIPPGAPPAEVF